MLPIRKNVLASGNLAILTGMPLLTFLRTIAIFAKKHNAVKISKQISMAANLTPIVAHGIIVEDVFKLLLIIALASLAAIYLASKLFVKIFKIRINAVYVAVICLSTHNLIVFALYFFSSMYLPFEFFLIACATTPFIAIILFVMLYIKLWPKFNPPPAQQQSSVQKEENEK